MPRPEAPFPMICRPMTFHALSAWKPTRPSVPATPSGSRASGVVGLPRSPAVLATPSYGVPAGNTALVLLRAAAHPWIQSSSMPAGAPATLASCSSWSATLRLKRDTTDTLPATTRDMACRCRREGSGSHGAHASSQPGPEPSSPSTPATTGVTVRPDSMGSALRPSAQPTRSVATSRAVAATRASAEAASAASSGSPRARTSAAAFAQRACTFSNAADDRGIAHDVLGSASAMAAERLAGAANASAVQASASTAICPLSSFAVPTAREVPSARSAALRPLLVCTSAWSGVALGLAAAAAAGAAPRWERAPLPPRPFLPWGPDAGGWSAGLAGGGSID
mmetsp:Transcript_5007/g.21483  ORF Transcript_5007/g.21483 Transcript_5007/m.21483 type:complete len:338 (-) Transcript_5007:1517-2530(-)